MNQVNDFIVIDQLPLSQKRYSNGMLYVSVPFLNDEMLGLDVRYFAHDDVDIIPTRNGFRVPKASLHVFLNVLKSKIETIDAIVCTYFSGRQLKARYKSDEYGDGVDFRYYKVTEQYEGWERRGLRFQIEDYKIFRQSILNFNFTVDTIRSKKVALKGKVVKRGPKDRPPNTAVSRNKGSGATRKVSTDYVNEVVKELMGI